MGLLALECSWGNFLPIGLSCPVSVWGLSSCLIVACFVLTSCLLLLFSKEEVEEEWIRWDGGWGVLKEQREKKLRKVLYERRIYFLCFCVVCFYFFCLFCCYFFLKNLLSIKNKAKQTRLHTPFLDESCTFCFKHKCESRDMGWNFQVLVFQDKQLHQGHTVR